MYFFVGETKGLTDAEKRSLFRPGKPYGRKLRPGEVYEQEDDGNQVLIGKVQDTNIAGTFVSTSSG